MAAELVCDALESLPIATALSLLAVAFVPIETVSLAVRGEPISPLPALCPIATLLLPSTIDPARRPNAVLLLPVTEIPAESPIAVLELPVTLLPAPRPIPVLELPV